MAHILAISSFVAHGHVGLAAMVPALQHFGHDVTALPTVVLSNHLAHPQSAGFDVACTKLHSMLDALDANGWLGSADAIVSGYLPTAQHVAFAKSAVQRVRAYKSDVLYVCDPVLGDDPKGLYVDATAAEAIKMSLVPLASVLTPNCFELEWLAGSPVTSAQSAIFASRKLKVPCVVATSIPASEGHLANLCTTHISADACSHPELQNVPKGTGDLMTGLLTAYLLDGCSEPEAMTRAAACVVETARLSQGCGELRLLASRTYWDTAVPVPFTNGGL